MDAIRTCSECGEPIPAERLEAKPDTTLCVNCSAESKKRRPVRAAQENPEYSSREREKKAKAQAEKNNRTIGSSPDWKIG